MDTWIHAQTWDFFLFIVHALSALDRDMDVYTTLQKPGLCPRSKATAQNWWTATFTIYKMVAHMSPRSWSAGLSPVLQRRPSTHLGSHWHQQNWPCNKRSCYSIRSTCCSLHTARRHNHLVAWHHRDCKVFSPWFFAAICPSSPCIMIGDKSPSQGEGEQVPPSPALPLRKRCQLWQ